MQGDWLGSSDARAFRLADILRTRAMIGRQSGEWVFRPFRPLIGRFESFFPNVRELEMSEAFWSRVTFHGRVSQW